MPSYSLWINSVGVQSENSTSSIECEIQISSFRCCLSLLVRNSSVGYVPFFAAPPIAQLKDEECLSLLAFRTFQIGIRDFECRCYFTLKLFPPGLVSLILVWSRRGSDQSCSNFYACDDTKIPRHEAAHNCVVDTDTAHSPNFLGKPIVVCMSMNGNEAHSIFRGGQRPRGA